VLVVNDSLKLIDYDGMYVPAYGNGGKYEKYSGERGPFEKVPPFEIDHLWMQTWDETLLANCPDADNFRTTDKEVRERVERARKLERARHKEMRKRVKRMEKLEEAIANGDALKVVRIARHLDDYPPLERARTENAALFERGKRARQALRALRKGDDKAVLATLDLLTVTKSARQFLPFRAQIRTLVEATLAGARFQPGQPSYQLDRQSGQITLRWTGWSWPHFGLPDRKCLIASHSQRFLQALDEVGEDTLEPGQLSCRDGYTLLSPQETDFVTIWPAVTLDWKQFGRDKVIGPPLGIGSIQLTNGKALRRWWPRGQKDD